MLAEETLQRNKRLVAISQAGPVDGGPVRVSNRGCERNLIHKDIYHESHHEQPFLRLVLYQFRPVRAQSTHSGGESQKFTWLKG